MWEETKLTKLLKNKIDDSILAGIDHYIFNHFPTINELSVTIIFEVHDNIEKGVKSFQTFPLLKYMMEFFPDSSV